VAGHDVQRVPRDDARRHLQHEAADLLADCHVVRLEAVENALARGGVGDVLAARQRRTERAAVGPETAVFLGDTMGELPVFLGAADAAFVGGSLVDVGGHNVLEPAALGLPVAFGPHMHNFAAIARMLLDAEAAEQVRNAATLGHVMARWLGDASLRTRLGENGRRVVENNRGALDRTLAMVEEMLPRG